MARATAICTCKKCGKEFEMTTIKRNRSEADSWEKWASNNFDICDACVQKEREEKAAELAEQAVEDGLPPLTGTERQRIWAEQIRGCKIEDMYKATSEAEQRLTKLDGENAEKLKESIMSVNETWLFILKKHSWASWWIDNRNKSVSELVHAAKRELLAEEAKRPGAEAVPVRPEEIIVPEEQTKGIVEVIVNDGHVDLRYSKDEDFRDIVKAARFTWDSDLRVWSKKINEMTGNAIDRAADISNTLLRNGFAVRCANADVRKMAVDATFDRECTLWVTLYSGYEYDGWLCITIPKGDNTLFRAAKDIKGSRWFKSHILVPFSNYPLVLDFAEIYSYSISKTAQAAVDAAEQARQTPVAPVLPPEPEETDRLGDILRSSDEVLDDLVD